MDCDTVIVRYGEIFLKSGYVRRQFTRQLVGNVRHALDSSGLEAKILTKRHRIYLKSPEADKAAKRVAEVFGVKSVSPAVEVDSDPRKLAESVVEQFRGLDGSFAVRVRRSRDYGRSSRELESMLGARIQEEYGNPVDLSNPDVTVGVEVKSDTAYVHTASYDGFGGLPYGTQGPLAAEVNTRRGALAAWMMMRRGCLINLLGPKEYAVKLSYYSNPGVKVYGSLEEALQCSLGLVSPASVEDVSMRKKDVPVYHPLIGFDDGEVEDMLSRTRL